MNFNNFNDEELIVLYLKGNFLALEFLFRKYFKLVFKFIYNFVSDKTLTKDLTQEVFLKVFKNIKQFKKDKNFKIWLFKIARNTVYDYFKKKKDYVFTDFEKENGEDYQIKDFLLKDEDLFKIYNNTYLIEKLKEEISNLSEKDKNLYFLYYEQNYSLKEVAEILNESLNTIKARHRRLILKLKKVINRLINKVE